MEMFEECRMIWLYDILYESNNYKFCLKHFFYYKYYKDGGDQEPW
jgi:hypothetical protein